MSTPRRHVRVGVAVGVLLSLGGTHAARSSRVASRATKGGVAPSAVSKGFAAPRAAKVSRRWADRVGSAEDNALEQALDTLERDRGQSIEAFLNPAIFDDPTILADMGSRVQAGEVVVVRDAFRSEFAEATHRELSGKAVPWKLNEDYFPDGYAYRHHNVYERHLWSERLNKTFAVFNSDATKDFMGELTARDCSGAVLGSPSHYCAGDHSLPHTDWSDQRTIAYVWHLSKDWRPEWGGALYWSQNDHARATYPASFNTLVLFSVTPTSAHFVTTVSPHAKQKRLAFNGWWCSSWVPTTTDDLEGVLSEDRVKDTITHAQLQTITDLLKWGNFAPERRAKLEALNQGLTVELFPDSNADGH